MYPLLKEGVMEPVLEPNRVEAVPKKVSVALSPLRNPRGEE